MADKDDILLALGEIKGELKGMNKQLEKIDVIDTRLRKTEVTSAVNGAISGGMVSVGLTLLIVSVKGWFKTGGVN